MPKPKKPQRKRCELEWRRGPLLRWHTATRVLLEMFRDRGHPTDPELFEAEVDVDTFLEIVKQSWNAASGFVFQIPGPTPVTVCFCRLEGLGIKDLRDLMEELGPHHDRLVLIVGSAPKPSVLAQTPPNTEIFTLDQLSCNITQHTLVPAHRLMTKSEVKAVLSKFRLSSASGFNKILVTDPIARYYGAKIGQVFEIQRPTPGGHSFTTWRVVARVPLK